MKENATWLARLSTVTKQIVWQAKKNYTFSYMPKESRGTTTTLTQKCVQNVYVSQVLNGIFCVVSKGLQQTHALVARPFFKLTTLDTSSNAEK